MEVAAKTLEAAIGEPVEATLRSPWIGPGLPDLIDSWLDRYDPGLVVLKINSFWFNYPSVPLHVERKLGPLGRQINRAGVRAGENPWLNRRAAFRFARRELLRTIGGAYYFTPAEVVASMQDCARRILAREGVGLMVSGPRARLNGQVPAKQLRVMEARRLFVHNTMKQFCADLHVPYIGQDVRPSTAEIRTVLGADYLHVNRDAARAMGEEEAAVLAGIWTGTHGTA